VFDSNPIVTIVTVLFIYSYYKKTQSRAIARIGLDDSAERNAGDGDSVKGIFQQEWGDQRNFEATLTRDGTFRTTTMVGNGGSMDVERLIKDADSKVLLDGYCAFNARLTRK